MGIVTIYMMRHGQTLDNVFGRLVGCDSDSALTIRGTRQLRKMGKHLAEVPFKKAYASPLQRAVYSRDLILEQRPVGMQMPSTVILDDLKDISWGSLDGMTEEEAQSRVRPDNLQELFVRTPDENGRLPFGMESRQHFLERFDRAMHEIGDDPENADQNVLVCAHHSQMIWIRKYMPEYRNLSGLGNGQVLVIRYNQETGRWSPASGVGMSPRDMEVDSINPQAVMEILRQASGLMLRRTGTDTVQTKGVANFVTDTDFGVQKFVAGKLRLRYPDVQFMAEEKNNADIDFGKQTWILDPVDGTMNLMRNMGHSCISLAYVRNGQIEDGFVYDPYRDEMFFAEKNRGAYLNGHRIHVGNVSEMKDALIAFGSAPYTPELHKDYARYYTKIYQNCMDFRRTGSAALDLAYVAAGRMDGYFEHVQSWDRAAGMLLVAEAGGKCTSFTGSEVPLSGYTDICAGTPAIVDKLVGAYFA